MTKKKSAITSAAAWREPREKGFVVTLQSGNTARIRPVALDIMIQDGSLPDLLSSLAAKALWTETDIAEIGKVDELAIGMAELFGQVCKAAFLNPRVVDLAEGEELGEDEITLADIDFYDKTEVFQLAISPAQVLSKFCEKQARDVESPRTGDDDAPEAE